MRLLLTHYPSSGDEPDGDSGRIPYDAVVDRHVCGSSAGQRTLEAVGTGVAQDELLQACSPGGKRRGADASPGVERDVVVVAAHRYERGHLSVACGEVEPEDLAIEALRGRDVRGLQVDVTEDRAFRETLPGTAPLPLLEEPFDVQRIGRHLEGAVLERPRVAGAVAVELDAVPFRVGEVERLADEMIGGALEWCACFDEPRERRGKSLPRREQHREVEQSR